MAELGQIIVNRVKPLLDTANNAGYETGYGNGFDSGYVSGEESVREYVDAQVEISKKAIIGRGGDISSDAGLEDLPQAIFNIPADASLAHYTDTEIAYRKSVPVGAEKYALLKSVGGMTYKCNNLIPYPYIETTKTENGITLTDNGDGSVTLNGTATETFIAILSTSIKVKDGTYTIGKISNAANKTGVYAQLYYKASDGSYPTWNISNQPVTLTMSRGITYSLQVVVNNGVTISNVTIYPMFNEGTALPYEPYYEGLRDSKVTEIVSVGANLFDDKTLLDFGFTKVAEHEYFRTRIWEILDKGAIFTNTSRASGSFTISAKLLYKNVGTTSSGLFAAATYTDGTVQELYPVNSIQGEYFDYIVSTNASKVLDYIKLTFGSSGVDTTIKNMQIARENVKFTPYRDEPIATKPIPKALQDIDGYGWGINADCYNYVDYEKKQFEKRADRAVFNGTETYWVKFGDKQYGFEHSALATFVGSVCLADRFTFGYSEKSGSFFVGGSGVAFNTDFDTLDEWKTYLAEQYANNTPVKMYYELAEPIITDISDILTGDNFIEVESGGSLEFVNEYKYAVPSTIKYTIKVGG